MILLQWVTLVQLRRFGEVVSAFFNFFLLIRFIHLRVRETKQKYWLLLLHPIQCRNSLCYLHYFLLIQLLHRNGMSFTLSCCWLPKPSGKALPPLLDVSRMNPFKKAGTLSEYDAMRCNSLKYSTVKPCAIQNNIMQNDIDSSPWTFLSQFTIYRRTSIKRSPTKRPPSIKRPFFKVPNFMSLNCCIKWPPLLSGRGQVIIYCF